MILKVNEIEFELNRITQLCGQNLKQKKRLVKTLSKYFSSEKYAEYEQEESQSIMVNHEKVGRKYFKVYKIRDEDSLLGQIKLGRNTLMTNYLKKFLEQFDVQSRLAVIDEELSKIYIELNDEVLKRIGKIEFDYDLASIWDMIQKTSLYGEGECVLEEIENRELLKVFLNLLVQVNQEISEKTIVIFENMDHMISRDEYQSLIYSCKKIAETQDMYFLFTTSLEKYVCIDENLITGITVVNDQIFNFPEIEHLKDYIEDHYPYKKEYTDNELYKDLISIIHRIGKQEYLYEERQLVICKLINDTLLDREYRKYKATSLEEAFLQDSSVI